VLDQDTSARVTARVGRRRRHCDGMGVVPVNGHWLSKRFCVTLETVGVACMRCSDVREKPRINSNKDHHQSGRHDCGGQKRSEGGSKKGNRAQQSRPASSWRRAVEAELLGIGKRREVTGKETAGNGRRHGSGRGGLRGLQRGRGSRTTAMRAWFQACSSKSGGESGRATDRWFDVWR
jgi:hypothetical protein